MLPRNTDDSGGGFQMRRILKMPSRLRSEGTPFDTAIQTSSKDVNITIAIPFRVVGMLLGPCGCICMRCMKTVWFLSNLVTLVPTSALWPIALVEDGEVAEGTMIEEELAFTL